MHMHMHMHIVHDMMCMCMCVMHMHIKQPNKKHLNSHESGTHYAAVRYNVFGRCRSASAGHARRDSGWPPSLWPHAHSTAP